MEEYMDVKSIRKNGDIILSEDNFNEFISDNNLVKFRNKTEDKDYIYRTFFTVFNGVRFFSETEETKKK